MVEPYMCPKNPAFECPDTESCFRGYLCEDVWRHAKPEQVTCPLCQKHITKCKGH